MFKIELGMKKHIHLTGIWLLVALLALMVACDPKEKVVEPMEKPLPELATIDSLMWRQPDSAFAVLRQFVASSEAESLDAFNGHYIQMLISELLYKKDYEQSNREALLDAVVYFDSLMANSRSLSQQERNVFLDARVHYINGVGFYEQGDVVQACSEYLNVLEIMKGNFQDQALTGIRAKFMFYTYNRLLELFSAQFMMASAIKCGEEALAYCQKEPSLSKEIPNTYFHIGKQYDKMGKKNNARDYYGRAIEGLSDINSLVYRDAVSMKAFCDYQVGHEVDSSLSLIRKMLAHANNEKERLTRLLVIGGIFTIEQSFDSALYYLKPVFENKDVVSFQIQAAEYLLINYNNLGNKEKADECIRFLGDNKKPDGEDKALVSKLEDLFKVYIDQKQEKEAEEAREKSIRKTIEIIVPIAIMIALTIFIVVKLRSKTLLKQQQEEADRKLGETEQEHEKEMRLWQAEADKTLEETKKKYEEELRQLQADTEQQLEEVERKHQQWMAKTKERHEEELRVQKDQSEKEIEKTKKRHEEELETERLAYQKEQEALRQNLQQREAQVSALEKVLEQQSEVATKRRAAFLDEEICQRILDLLHGKHITSRDTSFQHGIGLKEEDFKLLKDAVERHYKGFDNMLLSRCPSLKQSDLTLCHLHLLGLNEGEIGALKDRTYSAIKKQNENLQEKMGVEESLSAYVLKVAEGLCGPKNVNQKEEENMPLPQIMDGFEGQTEGISQESTFKSTLKDTLKGTQKTIVEIVISNPNVTIPEVARQLNLNPRGIAKHFKVLQDKGVIRRVGPDKGGHWEVIE
jgi:tetratricopeptide (TPR) repeat protein